MATIERLLEEVRHPGAMFDGLKGEDGCGYPNISEVLKPNTKGLRHQFIRGKRRVDSNYESRWRNWIIGESRVTPRRYRGYFRMLLHKARNCSPYPVLDELEGDEIEVSPLLVAGTEDVDSASLRKILREINDGLERPPVASMISPQSLQQLQRLII